MLTVAELVDALFTTYRKPNGREYSYVEVAEQLRGAIDPSHLSKLRSGHIKNPGRETLLALCQFFKVPSNYFFPELEPPTDPAVEPMDLLTIAARAKLSPAVKRKLHELIQALEDDDSHPGATR